MEVLNIVFIVLRSMRIYKMLFDEAFGVEMGIQIGVHAISVVNEPANSIHYVALSENRLQLSIQDTEKRIITGALLTPNQIIPRINKETGEKYGIMFPIETIEHASQDFLDKFNQKNITAEHLIDIEDVSVAETWIKTDAVHDKSVPLGIEAPVGSWMVSLKCNNDELWTDYVKTGIFKGFSIEGNFKPEEQIENIVNLKADKMDKKPNKKSALISAFTEFFKEEPTAPVAVALESEVAEVSKWWSTVVNDTFALGDEVLRQGGEDFDGNAQPDYAASAGEYELEDGRRIVLDGSGIIRHIFAAPGDEPVVEEVVAEEETVVEEEVVAEAEVAASKIPAVAAPAKTLKEVAKVIKSKEVEKVEMIAHTDAKKSQPLKRLKFDKKMTVGDRIKAGIEANRN
jgi:hypothetical protein